MPRPRQAPPNMKKMPFLKKLAFSRHNGALGRQISYVLRHIDPNTRDVILKCARRVYGDDHISKILDMRGNVIPATLDNVTIGAVLTDGSRVIGKKNIEEIIEEKQVGIEKIFLVPERCSPAQDVIRSIKEV